jgi:hypothetical protein
VGVNEVEHVARDFVDDGPVPESDPLSNGLVHGWDDTCSSRDALSGLGPGESIEAWSRHLQKIVLNFLLKEERRYSKSFKEF